MSEDITVADNYLTVGCRFVCVSVHRSGGHYWRSIRFFCEIDLISSAEIVCIENIKTHKNS